MYCRIMNKSYFELYGSNVSAAFYSASNDIRRVKGRVPAKTINQSIGRSVNNKNISERNETRKKQCKMYH